MFIGWMCGLYSVDPKGYLHAMIRWTFGFKNLPPVNGSNNSAPINQGEQSKAKVCRGGVIAS